LLAGLFVAAFAGQASAGTPGTLYPPQFRNQQVYFHCAGSTKLGNVSLAAENVIPSWNTTAPNASIQSGAGCGTEDINGVAVVVDPQENPTDGVWKGTFVGNLDQMTVGVYDFLTVGTAQTDGVGAVGVRLNIDGEDLTGDGTDTNDVNAVSTNSGATWRYDFSITNIGFVEPNEDVDGDGIGDNPFGVEEHTLTLTVDGYNPDQNMLGMWAYDTTEVPSGITFNPPTLAATVIRAADRV
jgi:hypothetical protein